MESKRFDHKVTFERPLPSVPSNKAILREQITAAFRRLTDLAGLDKHVNPRNGTVLCSVAGFLFFIPLCGLAVCFPSPTMRIVLPVAGVPLAIALSLKLGADLMRKQTYVYARNLGNTVLIVIFTLVALMLLYELRWYHQLNRTVIQVGQDTIMQPRYPAVTILAEKAAFQQGTLSPEPMKCFLGRFDETSPYCHDLLGNQFQTANSCNCNDSWVSGVRDLRGDTNAPDSTWGYRYVSFRPSEQLISRDEHDYITIQAFYNYNGTADLGKQGPQLWFMVYEPSISFEEAYMQNKCPPMRLYDANGEILINLALVYDRALDGSGYYKYDLQVSSIPSRKITCDISQGSEDLCHTTLRIQIPRTQRTIYQQKKIMNWSDVVAEAGSYFALVQFLSWMMSGQVWAAI